MSLAIYPRLKRVGQNTKMTSDKLPSYGRLAAFLSVSHASLVLFVWVLFFYAGWALVPGWLWLVSAWLWLAWPAGLLLFPTRRLLRTWVALAMGALLLTPCAPTIFAFTAWSIGGFR